MQSTASRIRNPASTDFTAQKRRLGRSALQRQQRSLQSRPKSQTFAPSVSQYQLSIPPPLPAGCLCQSPIALFPRRFTTVGGSVSQRMGRAGCRGAGSTRPPRPRRGKHDVICASGKAPPAQTEQYLWRTGETTGGPFVSHVVLSRHRPVGLSSRPSTRVNGRRRQSRRRPSPLHQRTTATSHGDRTANGR